MNDNGHTALHLAAMYGHSELVATLLQKKANFRVEDGARGWTALHWAADQGKLSTVRVLLENGADVEKGTSVGGMTPLHLATENGHLEVVEALLESKAKVNAENKLKETALLLAAKNGRHKVVKILLKEKADIAGRPNGDVELCTWQSSVGIAKWSRRYCWGEMLTSRQKMTRGKRRYIWRPRMELWKSWNYC